MIGSDARELAQHIARAPQGGTWDVGREQVADIGSGFIVGGAAPARTVVAPDAPILPDRELLAACAGALADARELGAELVGFWTDDRTGVLWLDVVDVVGTLREALTLARQRGELAVWDAGRGVEVRVA